MMQTGLETNLLAFVACAQPTVPKLYGGIEFLKLSAWDMAGLPVM